MGQRTTGLHKLLNKASIYAAWQSLLGANRCWETLVKTYVRCADGDRLLDIGCGTADILHFLPDNVQYTGLDLSERYIARAQQRWRDRGTFLCTDIMAFAPRHEEKMDIVLAVGLMHHLEDDEIHHLLQVTKDMLRERGRFITMDPCYVEQQHRIARWVIDKDRGQCVRTPAGYARLASTVFGSVKPFVEHNLPRIPYTHAVLECTEPC